MKSRLIQQNLNAGGDEVNWIRNAGGRGVGFMVLPAAPVHLTPGGPGYYPCWVRPQGSTSELYIAGPMPFFLGAEFQGFDLRMDRTDNPATTEDFPLHWNFITFEDRAEVVLPAGRPVRRYFTHQYPTAFNEVPTAAPTVATDGVLITPAWRNYALNFSGNAQDVNVWVYGSGPGGASEWFLSETIPSWAGTTHAEVFEVQVGGRRVALSCAGAGTFACFDIEYETA